MRGRIEHGEVFEPAKFCGPHATVSNQQLHCAAMVDADPVAEILRSCSEHHGDAPLGAVERALGYRRTLADRSAAIARCDARPRSRGYGSTPPR